MGQRRVGKLMRGAGWPGARGVLAAVASLLITACATGSVSGSSTPAASVPVTLAHNYSDVRPTAVSAKESVARVPARSKTRARPATVFGMSANGETALRRAEKALKLKAGIQGVFVDFTQSFPTYAASRAAARGALLMIAWEPWNSSLAGANQEAFSLDRIIAGDFDEYVRSFARDAAATRRPVFVRWAPEMNGDWHNWSTGRNGNDPGDYATAYRHVVDTAEAAGGANIKWVFNPIVSYEGSEPLAQLYPGDSYTDWVALDGYNWGSLRWGWQSWEDIFTLGRAELASVAPGKPLAIAEIGSTPGRNKPAWIRDTLTRARSAGVRMVVWFEHNKETDWRLSQNAVTSAAARAVVKRPGWVTGGSVVRVRDALGLRGR